MLRRVGALARPVLAVFAIVLGTVAQADIWPALYDVTRVRADDVLNIRTAPSANAPIIDHFAPNEKSIELLGVDPAGKWGRVRAGEQMGWASLYYLARQPGEDSAALPTTLRCGGTEPFWNLDFIAHGQSVVSLLGEIDTQYETEPLTMAANNPISHASVGTGPSGTLIVTVNRQLCSDGMSDLEFGLQTVIVQNGGFGTEVLAGCCSLR